MYIAEAAELRAKLRQHAFVEATSDLHLVVTAQDVALATPNDMCNCAIALALRRAVVADLVAVCRTVAYVRHPDEKGVVRLFRYHVPTTTWRLIDAFDKGEVVNATKVVLKKPSPHQTSKSGNERYRRQRANGKPPRKQRAAGTAPPTVYLRASSLFTNSERLVKV